MTHRQVGDEPLEPHVVGVLLSYNSLATLTLALAAIARQTRPLERLIVVDNGSSDGSREFLMANVEPENLVLLPRNLGVGAGHNAGWRKALTDPACTHIWTLEHDTVPAPDCLHELLKALVEWPGEMGAVVPAMSFPVVTHRSLFRKLARLRNGAVRRRKAGIDASGRPGRVAAFSFNGTVVPASVPRTVGFLRSDFVVGKEDRELSLRIRQRRLDVIRVPTARVEHLHRGVHGLEPVSRIYYSTRNDLYLKKFVENRRGVPALATIQLAAALFKIVLLFPDKGARIREKIAGYRDGLAGRMGFRGQPATLGSDR